MPADRAHSRPQHGARRARSRGLGSGGAAERQSALASRSAAARAARFRAAFRSAFRTRSTQLLEKIETELAAGYQRIKMKIKPGWDVDVVREVREAFPADQADGRRELGLHAGRRATI